MSLNKKEAQERLVIDFKELLEIYKDTSLSPLEFSHFIVYMATKFCATCSCCAHSTMMALQTAIADGICEALEEKLKPRNNENE